MNPKHPTPIHSNIMRVAVAGTSGLAQLIAHYVREETSHQLVMLSRKVSAAGISLLLKLAFPSKPDSTTITKGIKVTLRRQRHSHNGVGTA